jgi:F0F1-type ATP synthase gamma subunit
MASLRDIRRRIRSVRNTAQITRAMQMVAASRMRRAQQRVLASRPYSDSIRVMLGELSQQRADPSMVHPLLQVRPERRRALVVFTSDRGLAGPLNTNVLRLATEQILSSAESPEEIMEALLPRYVEVALYQILLETTASEHSARMVAMRNATENAQELVEALTLTYNKARQAAITKEITEISSAAEALTRA